MTILRTVGEALYGVQWQRALARDLGVSDRTMRRWAVGAPMPAKLPAELRRIILARMALLDDVAMLVKGLS